MDDLKRYKEEILKQMLLHYPDLKKPRIGDLKQIMGGADTTIYGFDVTSDSVVLPLVIRLFRSAHSGSAMKEFKVMEVLHAKGVPVPRPYLCNMSSSVSDRAYIIMERIDGGIFSDVLFNARSSSQYDVLLRSFVENLVRINSIEWMNDLAFLDSNDLVRHPDLFIELQISRPRALILKYGIEVLEPVIDWLHDNQPALESPCFLHSDYHGMNVLVQPNDSLVTIDWSNAKVGDFRFDLGFTALAMGSSLPDLRDSVPRLYESLSGQKIRHLDYFVVVSSLWNLLRIYSGLFDHQITGETAATIHLLAGEYYDYATAIIRSTQETTGISLAELIDSLRQYQVQEYSR